MPLTGEAKRAYQKEYMRGVRARKRAAARAEKRAALPAAVDWPDSVIPWIETLEVTQGEGAGGPLRLIPWEADWIGGLEATRRRTVGLLIARGAGKTTLTGSLGAAAVAGPWAVPVGWC